MAFGGQALARLDQWFFHVKCSIIALAHKLMRTMYFMFKRGEYYRDSATDYEALSVQRNAPRWIKALTRFVFIPAPV